MANIHELESRVVTDRVPVGRVRTTEDHMETSSALDPRSLPVCSRRLFVDLLHGTNVQDQRISPQTSLVTKRIDRVIAAAQKGEPGGGPCDASVRCQ